MKSTFEILISYSTHTNTITNYFTYKANTGKANHALLLGYNLSAAKQYLHNSIFCKMYTLFFTIMKDLPNPGDSTLVIYFTR